MCRDAACAERAREGGTAGRRRPNDDENQRGAIIRRRYDRLDDFRRWLSTMIPFCLAKGGGVVIDKSSGAKACAGVYLSIGWGGEEHEERKRHHPN